ncbi:MAG: type II toxin-antitoxin system RelE/ParE family toxin [Pseudomonadales bacterium]|jgi:toxin ParE1/3/4
MAQVIWTEPALIDLDEVAEYIALDKPSAAKKLVEDIFLRVELLHQSPNSGRKPPELERLRYREVIVGPCRIFYRFTNKKVYILYVMRSERELRNYILTERNSRHRNM